MNAVIRRVTLASTILAAAFFAFACMVTEPIEPQPTTSELRMRREWDLQREVVRSPQQPAGFGLSQDRLVPSADEHEAGAFGVAQQGMRAVT